METALFSPPKYTGTFATVNLVPERGYQVTLWQFGKAIKHTVHKTLVIAIAEIILAGGEWASETMQKLFEEDVITAGEAHD